MIVIIPLQNMVPKRKGRKSGQRKKEREVSAEKADRGEGANYISQ